MDLETLAVTLGSLCCFYYGILGVTIVCTSDCTGETLDRGGQTVQFTPLLASVYCSLALGTGYLLWKLRDHMRELNVNANLHTFASIAGHSTAEGAAWHAMSMRYGIIAFCLFMVVILWVRFKLIGPLKSDSCVPLPASQIGGAMWSVRAFLESMEWVVILIVAVFVLGFVFAASERRKFEGAAQQLGYGAAPAGAGAAASSLFGGGLPSFSGYGQAQPARPSLAHLQAWGPHESVEHAKEAQALAAAQAQAHASAAHAGQHVAYVQTPHGLVPVVAHVGPQAGVTVVGAAQALHTPAHAPAQSASISAEHASEVLDRFK